MIRSKVGINISRPVEKYRLNCQPKDGPCVEILADLLRFFETHDSFMLTLD
jgi:hypothetical protein